LNNRVLFGVNLPQASLEAAPTASQIVEFAKLAEDFRFHSLWVLERILHHTVSVLDPLSLLTFSSAVTREPKLGTAIVMTPLRNPVLLAKMISTMDNLSSGRLILGIAVGGDQVEFDAVGIKLTERAARFAENLRIMRELWSGNRVSYQGRFWTLKEASMKPQPIQKNLPIWIGGRADDALKRAVKYADGWIGSGASSFKQFEESWRAITGFIQEAGKPSSDFIATKRLYTHVDPDPDWAESTMKKWMTSFYGGRISDISQTCVYGPIEHCVETIQRYVDAGAKVLILHPVHDHLNQLRTYGSQIIPSF